MTNERFETTCRYYDPENGWCRLKSSWKDSMPKIVECEAGGCAEFEELNNRKNMTCIEWISVSKALPYIHGDYLVTIKQKYPNDREWEYDVDVASYVEWGGYIDDKWDTLNDWIEGQETHVTHWAPLPPPRMEQEESGCEYCRDEFVPALNWQYGLDHILPDYKYCPMCGRKMEEETPEYDRL